MLSLLPLLSTVIGVAVGLAIVLRQMRTVKNVFIILDDYGNVIAWRATTKDFINYAGKTYTIHEKAKPFFINGNKRYYIFKHDNSLPLARESAIKISPTDLYLIIKRISLYNKDYITNMFYIILFISIGAILVSLAGAYMVYQNQQMLQTILSKLPRISTVVNGTTVVGTG